MNSKGCSFILALLVAAAGLGIGYYKFRVQQQKALHDSRIAQWHDPLLAMLRHPAHIRFRDQAFSVAGYLCGEYALDGGGSDGSGYRRFVVSPDAVVIVGASAYTARKEARARTQRRQYQAELDAAVRNGATAAQAFAQVAWAPHCR